MSSSFRILTLSGLLLIIALGFSTSAHAAIFVNGVARFFANHDQGFIVSCLEVDSSANSSPASAVPCNATFFQQWNWEGTEIQGLGTTNVNRKCLDVRGGGTADGTIVQLFDCNGTGAQRWSYSDTGRVVNLGSGKCLDLKTITPAGVNVLQAVIQTCNANVGSVSQKWLIQ
jgi:Ricin-type beta-trefoil lectin domain